LEGGILEIGVWRGGSGTLIVKQAEICGIKFSVLILRKLLLMKMVFI
jgi:hypothetical protein